MGVEVIRNAVCCCDSGLLLRNLNQITMIGICKVISMIWKMSFGLSSLAARQDLGMVLNCWKAM